MTAHHISKAEAFEGPCAAANGEQTCRYLAFDTAASTFICAKHLPGTMIRINDGVKAGTLEAKGDNCEGRRPEPKTPEDASAMGETLLRAMIQAEFQPIDCIRALAVALGTTMAHREGEWPKDEQDCFISVVLAIRKNTRKDWGLDQN